MFEEDEILILEALGYKIFQENAILTSEGKYVPRVQVGNIIYESIYGDDIEAFERDYELYQKALKLGYIYHPSSTNSESLQVDSFLAKKSIELFEKDPKNNLLDNNNPLVKLNLEKAIITSENKITELLNTKFLGNEDFIISKIPELKNHNKSILKWGNEISGVYGLNGNSFQNKKDYYLKLVSIKKQILNEHNKIIQKQEREVFINEVKNYGEVIIVLFLIFFFVKKIIK
ncbi:hypothetical protein ACXIHB_07425 [Tenacibaculum sp. IMCC1]|uniref:Uncharacterized protein n=1 Tax=Tenacibaculum sp. Pbs-1 TaxID=3238748 RepID=A0AB33KX41_9FLAO